MADVYETLARNQERLDRLLQSQPVVAARARRLKRRTDAMVRRLSRMVGGAAAIALVAFLWGIFVSPIGFSGVALTFLAMVAIFFLLAFFPKSRDVDAQALPQASMKALPAQVEDWLDVQRKALPAPSRRELDAIMVQIDGIAPELAALPESDPRAADAQRLLTDHLPRLLKSFNEVPDRMRGKGDVERQLRDGLRTVSGELDRLSQDLAKDRLDALEVEGRFLENRYRRGPE